MNQVFKRASELLERRGRVPLPKGLTPHKLRHTFASVLIACGEDPISVMRQIGHTDPAFTLRVYSHLMSREPGERARLKALVNGERIAAVPAPQESPRVLGCAAYELPILRALKERGGTARRGEIRSAVATEVASALSDLDRQLLPSGEPRWEARFAEARSKLLAAGCLRADSPRGLWELAEAGVERLKGSGVVRLNSDADRQRSGATSEAIAVRTPSASAQRSSAACSCSGCLGGCCCGSAVCSWCSPAASAWGCNTTRAVSLSSRLAACCGSRAIGTTGCVTTNTRARWPAMSFSAGLRPGSIPPAIGRSRSPTARPSIPRGDQDENDQRASEHSALPEAPPGASRAVTGRYHPSVIAESLPSFITEILGAATREDRQAVADELIAEAREVNGEV